MPTTPRRRTPESEMTSEQLAAIQEVLARRRTPEARAEAAHVRAAVEQEFPPLAPDPSLIELVTMLRAERERQGLSLTDISERSGLDRSMVSRLELGKILNPTFATVTAYASALGVSLDWSVRPEVAVDGYGRPYIMTDPTEASALLQFLRSHGQVCVLDGGTTELRNGVSVPVISIIAMPEGTTPRLIGRLVQRWRTRGVLRKLLRTRPQDVRTNSATDG